MSIVACPLARIAAATSEENLTAMANSEYSYPTAAPAHTHAYLWPVVERRLQEFGSSDRRVFDLGCGNGAFADRLNTIGYTAAGVDPSESGIAAGTSRYPAVRLEVGSAYDDLSRFGQFPHVVSLEVIEHVYAPRHFARTLFELVQPGGIAVVSTPYNGYLKNVAIALLGKFDRHYTALWDHGHIKFWSIATLSTLMTETGFEILKVDRAGRIPALAKSMIFTVRRPQTA